MTQQQRSILAVAMLTQGVSVGMTFGILPVFLQPLESAFDAPRTQIASGQILLMFALTVGSILTGAALDRGYARRVMMGGACLMTAALGVASQAPNLWVLGFAALMAGFSIPSIGPLAAASLVTRAFEDERGRALGLMSMGPPLGSGAFALIAGWALLTLEWRQTLLIFAALAALLMIPLIWIVVPARFDSGNDSSASESKAAPAVSMAGMVRMPVFLWSAGVFAIAAGISSGWTTHVAAYLNGAGLDDAQASTWLAAQYWMGVPGAVVFGTLADRLGLTTLFIAMLGTAASCFGLLALSPDPVVIKAACVMFGFSFGGIIPLYMMLLGARMGPDAFGRAMGLSNLMMLPVVFGSVMLAASVFEATGGYSSALTVFAVGLLLAIGCLFGSNWSAQKA